MYRAETGSGTSCMVRTAISVTQAQRHTASAGERRRRKPLPPQAHLSHSALHCNCQPDATKHDGDHQRGSEDDIDSLRGCRYLAQEAAHQQARDWGNREIPLSSRCLAYLQHPEPHRRLLGVDRVKTEERQRCGERCALDGWCGRALDCLDERSRIG